MLNINKTPKLDKSMLHNRKLCFLLNEVMLYKKKLPHKLLFERETIITVVAEKKLQLNLMPIH
jgi:hypothetical protein